KYNAKAYDRIGLMLKKEGAQNKDAIQAAADADGKSVNGYIIDAITQKMERAQHKGDYISVRVPRAAVDAIADGTDAHDYLRQIIMDALDK
ncbi:MAG: hypothetical protein RR825_05225, partial [Ruthenibacterium sp.]